MQMRKNAINGWSAWGRCLLVSAVAAMVGCASSSVEPIGTTVRVEQGYIRGSVSDGVVEFSRVPYAEPPLGPRRWAPPQAPSSWSGTLDATRPFMPCAQQKGDLPAASSNEDCLYLAITVPRETDAHAPKPVMVWLHGGGLSGGTANQYDPSYMAKEGDVIVVTVESRLNVFGYFAHPGLAGSGTYGLLDEQAALRWIRQNIGSFGGDPGNVTLFGESGGAVRTCAHLTSPEAAGFDKVILQSGGCSTSWPESLLPFSSFWSSLNEAEALGLEMARELGCGDGQGSTEALECLREVPADRILESGAGRFTRAAYGTDFLPTNPARAVREGRYPAIPVISGHTRNEGRAMVGLLRMMGQPVTDAVYRSNLRDAFGKDAARIEERYPITEYEPHEDAAALAWAAVITDRMFACPQIFEAEALAKRGPTFTYLFADPNGLGMVPFPPGFPSGASHSSELPLLFDLTNGAPIDITTGETIPLSSAQRSLREVMVHYWTNFAHSGDPNEPSKVPFPWPSNGPSVDEPQTLLLAPEPATFDLVDVSVIHQCSFWQEFID